jgi:hypothetical protein
MSLAVPTFTAMKKTPDQAMKALGILSKQMVDNAKAGDIDLYLVYVNRGNHKQVMTRANTSMLGAMVGLLDIMNRMGVDDATQNAVRHMIGASLGLSEPAHQGVMIASQDGVPHGQEAEPAES